MPCNEAIHLKFQPAFFPTQFGTGERGMIKTFEAHAGSSWTGQELCWVICMTGQNFYFCMQVTYLPLYSARWNWQQPSSSKRFRAFLIQGKASNFPQLEQSIVPVCTCIAGVGAITASTNHSDTKPKGQSGDCQSRDM